MALPRAFVSSVVDGFSEYREAARRAIIAAGGEPVLVNEDFPALAASSRNACLDGVKSSDVYLALVGERGGWVTPSGKTAVEEEYDEAVRRKIRVLVFIKDGPHDAAAESFIMRASNYVTGTFRRAFSSPQELEHEIRSALLPLISRKESPVSASAEFARLFPGPKPQGNEVVLRVILAPEREEEVIDPVRIGSPELLELIYTAAHTGSVGLLDFSKAKERRIDRDTLRIHQANTSGHGTTDVTISLSERGLLVVDADVTGRTRDFSDGMVVAREEMARRMTAILTFYARVMTKLDAFERHNRFFINVALLNLGFRSLVRNPKPQSSHSTNIMRGDGPVVAYQSPRLIARADLSSPDAEVERAITVIERELS